MFVRAEIDAAINLLAKRIPIAHCPPRKARTPLRASPPTEARIRVARVPISRLARLALKHFSVAAASTTLWGRENLSRECLRGARACHRVLIVAITVFGMFPTRSKLRTRVAPIHI
jgi:hypothetical protein